MARRYQKGLARAMCMRPFLRRRGFSITSSGPDVKISREVQHVFHVESGGGLPADEIFDGSY